MSDSCSGGGAGATPELSPTLGENGRRVWIYPDRRRGPHGTVRRRLAFALMAVYLATPWLTVRGVPILRFDVSGGRLFLGGAVLQFSDTSWLAFALVGLALMLFFVTALRGRIWCGYACPQTVFVEWVIRPIEELTEGPAHHRRLSDRGPRTWRKARGKLLKHALFTCVAAVVANVFLAYFYAPADVLAWMRSSPSEHPLPFVAMTTVTAVFYLDLSWFREQFCAFLCPYARFQSVMMDRATPAVAYDVRRGEPRGRRSGGDCIDCGLCQRVCPTGIDIRDGHQLECINCNRCADACDAVMGTLKRPAGLIRAACQAELAGKPGRGCKRPRLAVYAAAIAATFSVLAHRLYGHDSLTYRFTRQTGTTYGRLADGRIFNSFELKVANESGEPQSVALSTPSLGVQLICGSCAAPLRPYGSADYPVMVFVDPVVLGGVERIELAVGGRPAELPLLLPGGGR